jgi:hypothetical protein
MKIYDMKCEKCNKEYYLNPKQFYQRNKRNNPNLCFNCMEIHLNEIRSKNNREYMRNLSQEEKKKRITKQKNTWANKSEEEMKLISDKQREIKKNESEEKRKIRINKTSNKLTEFYKNESKKEKEVRIQKQVKTWNNKSIEEKEKNNIMLNLVRKEYMENETNNQKKNRYIRISIGRKKYYEDLSIKDYQEQCRLVAIEFNKNNNSIPNNKLEIEFANTLNKYNIKYKYRYYNEIKHKDFDKLFPYNPITCGEFIKPYHEWDFIIYTKQGNILIDIDGDIHDESKTNYYVTDKCNRKFILKDLIEFNDSQRFYQTISIFNDNITNLSAYIIKAYDNKLENNIFVYEIKNDVTMNYEGFLNHLQYLNEIDESYSQISFINNIIV